MVLQNNRQDNIWTAYDEAAVKENQKKKAMQEQMKHMGGCPGSKIKNDERIKCSNSSYC